MCSSEMQDRSMFVFALSGVNVANTIPCYSDLRKKSLISPLNIVTRWPACLVFVQGKALAQQARVEFSI